MIFVQIVSAVLERAIYVVPLFAAVFFLRLVMRRAPRWILGALWAVVALGLVFPAAIRSPLSVYGIGNWHGKEFKITEYVGSEGNNTGLPDTGTDFAEDEHFYSNMLMPYAAADSSSVESGGNIWLVAAAVIWFAGEAMMIGYGAVSSYKLRKYVRASIEIENGIYICDDIDTAFVLGMLRHRIYVPSWVPERERAFVIAHERAHIARGDHWWKPIGFVLLSIYWFHPLCWAAYIMFCRDMELACDEKVVREMALEDRQAYSKALLSVSSRYSRWSAGPLAFGETGIKIRIRAVLNYKKPPFWIVCSSVAVCGAVAVCFLTVPMEKGGAGAIGRITTGEMATAENIHTVYPKVFENEYETLATLIDAESVVPGEVQTLVRAEIHEWFGDFVLTDPDSLSWLEKSINSAAPLDYETKCPFGITIFLFQESGAVGTIEPACDSCDVINSGGVFYDVGNGWNSNLWNIFGIEHSFTKQEFDGSGNLIRETEYSWFQPMGTWEYEYDRLGNLTAEQYKTGESVLHRTEYEYDSEGRAIRSDYYSSAGRNTLELVNYSQFELDESGNVLADVCYYPSGQIKSLTRFEYDSDGRRTKVIENDGSYTEFRYGEKGFVGEYLYSEDGRSLGYYERWYDESGNMLRINLYEADGRLNSYDIYAYDDKGELAGHANYNGEGELTSVWGEGV